MVQKGVFSSYEILDVTGRYIVSHGAEESGGTHFLCHTQGRCLHVGLASIFILIGPTFIKVPLAVVFSLMDTLRITSIGSLESTSSITPSALSL